MKRSDVFLLTVAGGLFAVLCVFAWPAAVGTVIGGAIAAGLIVFAQKVLD